MKGLFWLTVLEDELAPLLGKVHGRGSPFSLWGENEERTKRNWGPINPFEGTSLMT
jgi:hypothetical protein